MKNTLLSFALLAGPVLQAGGLETPALTGVRPALILVKGAAGSAEYAPRFDRQMESWKKMAVQSGAELLLAAGDVNAAAGTTDRARLEKILTDLPREGPAEVWVVLIGHGTWDGKEARFNLEGPDLTAADLAGWLQPVQRPVVVINTASSSAPFLPVLAGPNRTIITATRSGNERNFTRFGESLAASLEDPAADYDQDGQTSLLEWFLRASSRTTEFYLAEGRILTEHALIDDNGDGKGTPAAWFRGLRATTKAKDNTPLDGSRAHQRTLLPDPSTRQMTAEQLAERERLEGEMNALREKKPKLPEDEYYRLLEGLLRQVAAIYEAGPEGRSGP
jgi:hypothetical protein